MSVRPWREIAQPHEDVLEGTFKQSEFAADITQVASGKASPEYQDPEQFFARTFITEGMRLLLVSVAQRLAGKGGDPVVQLQTAFGGGKTHTLLAVYHLASRAVGTDKLSGIPPILDEAGIDDLPGSRVAVIDGIRLSPSQGRAHEGVDVNTLWGELAWSLLGADGYELVAESDRDGTSPGKEVLAELLKRAAPCVILIDELVAYVRQFEPGKQYRGGTFDSNISFIQGLTEAIKGVPNAILLASLPESQLEIGGTTGQQALESLEKYFGRVESIWKPVGTEEAFEIVRRRLFSTPGDRSDVEATCRAFADLYRSNADRFPDETQAGTYFDRLCSSYPIHPEIFDRLYEDWSTLDKFQRTRGVLQYMAIVIHHLWNSENRDGLIMPGSIPLDESVVRTKSIHYLPQGWEPVIESEIDGVRSTAGEIDGKEPRFGSVQAARRTARTVFLGSAPSVSGQNVRGIETERILLGAVQPGQTVGLFEDVLKRLRDRLHYLYAEEDRYWFDTKPNLRREMEGRKERIDEETQVLPALKRRVTDALRGASSLGGFHVFSASSDVPDEIGSGPRLVVLPPSDIYRRGETSPAVAAAESILRNRGDQPRQRQNRLLFLAPDVDAVGRLREQTRALIAWESIVEDIRNGTLNHDRAHENQAKRNRESTETHLKQMVREAYRWILAPTEEIGSDGSTPHWEALQISTTTPSLVRTIEERLTEEEWLTLKWSPIHLRNLLAKWYFKDGVSEVNLKRVWDDTTRYLYMPRLASEHVFRDAVSEGLMSREYFGYAAGREGEEYLGFIFGEGGSISVDESSLLVVREEAQGYRMLQEERDTVEVDSTSPTSSSSGGEQRSRVTTEAVTGSTGVSLPTRFYGTRRIDPISGGMEVSQVIENIIEHLRKTEGASVTITLDVAAETGSGFSEATQRTVRENARELGFEDADFGR